MGLIKAMDLKHGQLAFFEEQNDDTLNLCLLSIADKTVTTLQSGLRSNYRNLIWAQNDLYYAAHDGNWFHDIWRFNVTTHETEQITDYFHTNSYPIALHPDEDAILAISNLRGAYNLRIFDIPNETFRKITDYASPVRAACYSADGKQIAYSANATDNPHNVDIFLMNDDGFNKQPLVSTLAGAVDLVQRWHPDGRYLAVESNYENGWSAGIFNLEDHGFKWFTSGEKMVQILDFSPDGSKLLIRTSDCVTAYTVPAGEIIPIAVTDDTETDAVWLDNEHLIVTTEQGGLYTYVLISGEYEKLV